MVERFFARKMLQKEIQSIITARFHVCHLCGNYLLVLFQSVSISFLTKEKSYPTSRKDAKRIVEEQKINSLLTKQFLETVKGGVQILPWHGSIIERRTIWYRIAGLKHAKKCLGLLRMQKSYW